MPLQIKRLRIPKKIKELAYSNNYITRQQAEEKFKENIHKSMLKKGIYIDKEFI